MNINETNYTPTTKDKFIKMSMNNPWYVNKFIYNLSDSFIRLVYNEFLSKCNAKEKKCPSISQVEEFFNPESLLGLYLKLYIRQDLIRDILNDEFFKSYCYTNGMYKICPADYENYNILTGCKLLTVHAIEDILKHQWLVGFEEDPDIKLFTNITDEDAYDFIKHDCIQTMSNCTHYHITNRDDNSYNYYLATNKEYLRIDHVRSVVPLILDKYIMNLESVIKLFEFTYQMKCEKLEDDRYKITFDRHHSFNIIHHTRVY